MKKYLYEIFIIIGLLVFAFAAICYGQVKSLNVDAPTTQVRDGVTSNDSWLPAEEDTLGTAFDASNYEQVRVYVKITNAGENNVDNTTSCTLRPLIWNNVTNSLFTGSDTPSGWSVDSPNVVTGVTNDYTFLWETRHAREVQMLIDTISGSGSINVYMQGSNSLNLNK